MANIDWSNPILLTVIGILVLVLAASFLSIIPAIIKGILRLAVIVVIIVYILQYTGTIAPVLPSLRDVGQEAVDVTQTTTTKSKAYLKDKEDNSQQQKKKADTDS